MQALAERIEQLEKAFNTNTKAFSDGIQMIEAQQEVLRRVTQSLLDGTTIKDGEGKIAFNYYLKTYIEELASAEEKAAAEKTHVAAHPIVSPGDEGEPIIFGG
jgi:hypothetical protein